MANMIKLLEAIEVKTTTSFAGVNYDQRYGIGSVPDNQNINYKGFAVFMYPSIFLNLARKRDFSESSGLDHISKALVDGKPIGSPFLDVFFQDENIPVITGHEGRTRCKAIQEVFGNKTPVLVHCFLAKGRRARHITIEDISRFNALAIPQDQGTPITGPFFASKIWFMGGWKSLPQLDK